MARRGAEFSDVQPRGANGAIPQDANRIVIAAASQGTGIAIDTAVIQQVTPLNSFRLGQQIFFHLGVFNPTFGANDFMTRLRLKPWWLRPNLEYRAAGDPSYLPIDQFTFRLATQADNRYVWIPGPKRLDGTQFQTPPPPAAPVRHSDSLMLDDIWTLDLPSPLDAAYIAKFPAPQQVSRWIAFFYPAMGYALGFTAEATTNGGTTTPNISLTWSVGTLGGTNYQESLG